MRVALIAAFVLAFSAACASNAEPDPTPSPTAVATRTPRPAARPTATPTIVPTPEPTAEPTPVPTPSGTVVDLTGSQPRQGGFLVVRLYGQPADITYATAYFAGVGYTMLPYGDHWAGLVGLPTWQPLGGYPIEVVGDPGSLASGWADIGDGGFAYEDIELPPEVGGLLQDAARIEAERIQVQNILAGFTVKKYWSGPWIMPATGVISNAFGLQRSFNGGPYSPHTGTDIASDQGTPIYASASGVVAYASALYLYGNSVIIDHGVGVFSSYNHMDSLIAAEGQYVNQGDAIGYMGTTGFSTGPHVHWEANVHGVHTDPMLWTQVSVEP